MNKIYFLCAIIFNTLFLKVNAQHTNTDIAQAINAAPPVSETGLEAIIMNSVEDFNFTSEKVLKTTPVKDQCKTNTCWCFSSVSLLESELLRNGKGEYCLSPMSIVRQTYISKAKQYLRMHGEVNFAAGGTNRDVIDVVKNYGIIPEVRYSGLKPHEKKYNQFTMDSILLCYIEGVAASKKLDPNWIKGFEHIMDKYMGVPPDSFTYNDKVYTPKTFAEDLHLNLEDYVVFTSFTHHPFYEKFVLEVPDNWTFGEVYNVPLEDLMKIIDGAIDNDYTIAWAADITEKGFQYSKGFALIPDVNEDQATKTDWQAALTHPGKEINVTQQLRQQEFDDFSTTDDHGMQIVGIAKDQTGKKYYYVKNSWGASNSFKGYIYASENYVKLKTTSVMINKNALPLYIRNKFKDLN